MQKMYHIGRDGTVKECRAHKQGCQLGGVHGSAEVVQQEIDRINAKHHGFITNLDEASKIDDKVERRVMRSSMKVSEEESVSNKATVSLMQAAKLAAEKTSASWDDKPQEDAPLWDKDKAYEIHKEAKGVRKQIISDFFNPRKMEPVIVGIGRRFAAKIRNAKEAGEFHKAHFDEEELKRQKAMVRPIVMANMGHKAFKVAAVGLAISNPVTAVATVPVSLMIRKVRQRQALGTLNGYYESIYDKMEENKDSVKLNATAHISERERKSARYSNYTMTPNEVREYARDFLRDKYGLELSVPVFTDNSFLGGAAGSVSMIPKGARTNKEIKEGMLTKERIPIKMTFSEGLIKNGDEDAIKSVIRHEAIHYALARKGVIGSELSDGGETFERELLKHKTSSSPEVVGTQWEGNIDPNILKAKTEKGLIASTGHRMYKSERDAYNARKREVRLSRKAERESRLFASIHEGLEQSKAGRSEDAVKALDGFQNKLEEMKEKRARRRYATA